MSQSYDGWALYWRRHRLQQPPSDDSALDLPRWTPIAKLRPNGKGPRWNPVPDAPVKPCEARRMADRGVLLMAHRVQDDGTYLVVKTPARTANARSSHPLNGGD